VYHNQSLIPMKTLDMSGGVNVTIGMPAQRGTPRSTGIGSSGCVDGLKSTPRKKRRLLPLQAAAVVFFASPSMP
jgi:hypothetical protein